MIPKAKKFPMRTQFLEFRRSARQLHTPHLTVYFQPSPLIQLAAVVPKKVNKRAVVRNYLKRLLKKELLDHQFGQIVVLVKPLPLEKSQLPSLAKELRRLLRQINTK